MLLVSFHIMKWYGTAPVQERNRIEPANMRIRISGTESETVCQVSDWGIISGK